MKKKIKSFDHDRLTHHTLHLNSMGTKTQRNKRNQINSNEINGSRRLLLFVIGSFVVRSAQIYRSKAIIRWKKNMFKCIICIGKTFKISMEERRPIAGICSGLDIFQPSTKTNAPRPTYDFDRFVTVSFGSEIEKKKEENKKNREHPTVIIVLLCT